MLLTSTPDASAARARRALGGLAHVVSAEMHVEFLTPGVNKGAALTWLCAREGLSCAHAVTFGDNHNDAEMLRAAAPQGHKGVVTGPSRWRHSSLPWPPGPGSPGPCPRCAKGMYSLLLALSCALRARH